MLYNRCGGQDLGHASLLSMWIVDTRHTEKRKMCRWCSFYVGCGVSTVEADSIDHRTGERRLLRKKKASSGKKVNPNKKYRAVWGYQ